jgi:Resolvase, N terminal domain
LDELTKRNVKLSLGGSIHDPTDPVGRLLFNVLAMVAEFESDLIRLRRARVGVLPSLDSPLNPRIYSDSRTNMMLGNSYAVCDRARHRQLRRAALAEHLGSLVGPRCDAYCSCVVDRT